jgi:hypothetical protein
VAAAASGWLVLVAFFVAGCGLASNPQPPTLWLPEPVKDLAATRSGNEVHLHWTMPKQTTDKVALKGDQRAHVCWVSGALAVGNPPVAPRIPVAGKPQPGKATAKAATAAPAFDAKACHAAGDGMFTPDKPASLTVKMPAELVSAPRAVSYFVELQNHAGKTAGPSNAGLVATGVAPQEVTGLRVETQAQGVVLHWDPAAAQGGLVLRIHRELAEKPGAVKTNESSGAPPPEAQVLEVDLDKADPGVALDRDATLDHEWKYWTERVLRVKADGQTLEIAGRPSQTVTIDAKDVFPPAAPAGLAAVADEQAKAIDLSWTPDTDADLAGYVVYRRDVTAGGEMDRISPKAPVVPPSFVDATAVAGHRYAYVVSAVDQDGNESARSGEVEEELPQ